MTGRALDFSDGVASVRPRRRLAPFLKWIRADGLLGFGVLGHPAKTPLRARDDRHGGHLRVVPRVVFEHVRFESWIPIGAGLEEELPLLTRPELAKMPEHGRHGADDLRPGCQALTYDGLSESDSLITGFGGGRHLHEVGHAREPIEHPDGARGPEACSCGCRGLLCLPMLSGRQEALCPGRGTVGMSRRYRDNARTSRGDSLDTELRSAVQSAKMAPSNSLLELGFLARRLNGGRPTLTPSHMPGTGRTYLLCWELTTRCCGRRQ